MLKVGDRVPLELGGAAQVTAVIGAGGQGTVYRAEFAGREYALKMYFPNKLRRPDIFRENLARLCESRHSVTYFNMDGDNSTMGFPKPLLGFLRPYMKARFGQGVRL